MAKSTPTGITPPTPGLEHEEPEMAMEADIPSDDGEAPAAEPDGQGSSHGSEGEQRPLREVERE
jgi:hypothetical protein